MCKIDTYGRTYLQWPSRQALLSEPLTLPSEALSAGGVFLMNRMALIRNGRLDRVGGGYCVNREVYARDRNLNGPARGSGHYPISNSNGRMMNALIASAVSVM